MLHTQPNCSSCTVDGAHNAHLQNSVAWIKRLEVQFQPRCILLPGTLDEGMWLMAFPEHQGKGDKGYAFLHNLNNLLLLLSGLCRLTNDSSSWGSC